MTGKGACLVICSRGLILKNMQGIPFIISGPSGAGKTTLYRLAVKSFQDVTHSVSYTTRVPRLGDKEGVDYRFVDNDRFDRMVEAGEFIEHAEVHGKKYGTSEKDLKELLDKGFNVILEIDVQGADMIRKRLEGGVYIFILPPSVEVCEQRLKSRGKDSSDEIEKRLRIAREEIKKAGEYEYIIINDDVDSAFETLKSIIVAERAKRLRVMDRVNDLFGQF